MIVVIPAECGVTLYGGRKRFRFRAADAAAERDGGSWLRPATRLPKESRSTRAGPSRPGVRLLAGREGQLRRRPGGGRAGDRGQPDRGFSAMMRPLTPGDDERDAAWLAEAGLGQPLQWAVRVGPLMRRRASRRLMWRAGERRVLWPAWVRRV